MSTTSQCDRLLYYLAKHGSVTLTEAQRELGIPVVMRRIHDLRKRGVQIETIEEKGTNRFGEPCEYARYVLKQEQMELAL
jgi:biotin operon repressor